MSPSSSFIRSLGTVLACGALTVSSHAVALNISEAQGHNLVVWNNATLLNSDIEGSAAVGGNSTFDSYSIGNSLAAGNPTQGAYIVGGNLNAGNGQVYKGSIYVGGTYTGPGYALNSAPGSVTQSNLGKANVGFNFASAQTALTQKSATYGSQTANGVADLVWGTTLNLTGTDPLLNIFSITAAQLAASTNFVLDITAGSQALINVSGQNINFSGGLDIGSTSRKDVLFNFYQANTAFLTSIGIKGSILAPNADVTFQWGHQDGQLIAKSFTGMGELHNYDFNDRNDPPKQVPDTASTLTLLVGAFAGLVALARRRV